MRVLTPTPEALATLERLRDELKWRKYDSPSWQRAAERRQMEEFKRRLQEGRRGE